MQVDVVRHLVVGVVLQVELDRVALAHADELAGHLAAEGPERVVDAVGDRHLDFLHLELDDDFRRLRARHRGRDLRRRRQLRLDRVTLRRTEVTFGGASRICRWLGG